jgi:uncharacterized protein with PIN domain
MLQEFMGCSFCGFGYWRGHHLEAEAVDLDHIYEEIRGTQKYRVDTISV